MGTWQEDYVLGPAAVLVQKIFDKIGLVHFINANINLIQVFQELFLFHFTFKAAHRELMGNNFMRDLL